MTKEKVLETIAEINKIASAIYALCPQQSSELKTIAKSIEDDMAKNEPVATQSPVEVLAAAPEAAEDAAEPVVDEDLVSDRA